MTANSSPAAATPRFAVVCPAWNCEQWAERCLASIRSQTHRNFRCIYLDDISSDRTIEVAQAAVQGDDRFTVLRNDVRRFPLGNIVQGTRRIAESPDDVIVIVDGDDWLKHDRVLERVAREYADPDVWMTYGNHELLNRPWRAKLRGRVVRGTRRYPKGIEQKNLYRYCKFYGGHLRTYRRFLFDAIRDEDLRDDDGNYYWGGGDFATMVPMLEMATPAHARYLDEVLYVYNNGHPLAELRPETVDAKIEVKARIIARPRYEPLPRRP